MSGGVRRIRSTFQRVDGLARVRALDARIVKVEEAADENAQLTAGLEHRLDDIERDLQLVLQCIVAETPKTRRRRAR